MTDDANDTSVQDVLQNEVVVAEDELAHRKMIELALQAGGYRVVVFENGQDVLDHLADQHVPSLFVFDINMPFVDGLTLCRRVKQNPDFADVPVIIVTALKDEKTKRQGKEVAADLVFQKPINRQEFLTAVSMLLRQAEKRSS